MGIPEQGSTKTVEDRSVTTDTSVVEDGQCGQSDLPRLPLAPPVFSRPSVTYTYAYKYTHVHIRTNTHTNSKRGKNVCARGEREGSYRSETGGR